jgi:hypothetical protein
MGAHESAVASYFALFATAKTPGGYRLGLQPVAGDQNGILYLEGFPSFAQMEADDKAIDAAIDASPAFRSQLNRLDAQTGPLHASQSTMLAVYRPDLSYRPLKMEEVATSRYFNISKTKVNPGRAADYAEWVKQWNRARAKANLDEHSAVFQVITGGAPQTYLVFTATKSLAEWDEFGKNLDARTKAINEALGGDMAAKNHWKMFGEIIASSSTSLYAFNPKISRPAPAFAAADMAFWAPQAAGKALAVKKEKP